MPVGGDGFRREWADPDNRGAAACVELPLTEAARAARWLASTCRAPNSNVATKRRANIKRAGLRRNYGFDNKTLFTQPLADPLWTLT